jgi:hypothetical protein
MEGRRMIATAPLTGLLRLAEGIPTTPENFRGRGELIQGLLNLINIAEKEDDE